MNTLQLNRVAIEAFKILYNMSTVYIRDLVNFISSNYFLRYKNLLEIPRVNIETCDKKSFRYEIPTYGTAFQMN